MSRRLRWALRAYPSDVRKAERDVLLSLACDLADEGGSSINREAVGLLRGGLVLRLGAVASAPWEPALRRASLQIAGATFALVCGAAGVWLREPAWPGWSWLAVLAAPALVVAGQIAGRRLPVACGALLLIVLGAAQANDVALGTTVLRGSLDYDLRGSGWMAAASTVDLPLLSFALPGAVVMLASAAHRRRPMPRRAASASVVWVIAGAVAVRLALSSASSLNPVSAVSVGDVRVDGLGLCMIAAGLAAIAAMAVGFARRRRDPAGMLAGTLAVTAILPVACLHVLGVVVAGERDFLVAVAVSAIAIGPALLGVVRRAGALNLRPGRT